MIHISFQVGDRVKVIKQSLDSYGLCGTITKLHVNGYRKSVWVRFDCWKNGKEKELYINKENLRIEREDFRMAKLTGFNKVAVVEQGCEYNTKDYFYALYNDNISVGDKVLVSGSASGQIWTVKDIFEYAETIPTKNITAEVICKVDTSAYDERCINRKKAEELRKQMDKKRKEIEARKDDEYYASLDSEYAEMLAKMKEMVC